MAARKRTSFRRTAPNTLVILDNDAPMARRSAGRAPVRRRRRRSGGRSGGTSQLADDALAGAAFGLLERVTANLDLPEIPLLGRKGIVALAAYFLRRQHPLIAKAARAGVIISSYELVSEGKITGE